MTTAIATTQAAGEDKPRGVSAEVILASVDAIKRLGDFIFQSGIAGSGATAGSGAIIAWGCLAEGITALDFVRKYHLIDGRPSMRADAMLAELRSRGGKYEWLDTGDKSGRSVLRGTFQGQSLETSFSVDDAKSKGLIKDGKGNSNWAKWPAEMCRARCISALMRMLAPEIVAGVYTPEEIEDFGSSAIVATTRSRSSAAPAAAETKPAAQQSQAAAEDVIEAAVEPVATTAVEAVTIPPTEPPATSAEEAARLECLHIITSPEGANTTLVAFDAAMVKAKPGWPGLNQLPPELLTKTLNWLTQKYPRKN